MQSDTQELYHKYLVQLHRALGHVTATERNSNIQPFFISVILKFWCGCLLSPVQLSQLSGDFLFKYKNQRSGVRNRKVVLVWETAKGTMTLNLAPVCIGKKIKLVSVLKKKNKTKLNFWGTVSTILIFGKEGVSATVYCCLAINSDTSA